MLIAIEGIDGSGKGTQAQLLRDRLDGLSIDVVNYSFPQYGNNVFADMIAKYLNGDSETSRLTVNEIASLYANDRLCARERIWEFLKHNTVVICDRYVDSNLAHQGARIPDPEWRQQFIQRAEKLEYEKNGMPVPDMTFYLDLPVGIAMQHIQQKAARAYTEAKADRHEADPQHLETTRAIYRELAARDNTGRVTIPCMDGTLVRKPEYIADHIWESVLKFLFGQDPR